MGSGPSVILVHGLLGSCATMGMLARGLAPQFEVLTVDLRNHGGSFHAPTMTYKDMAQDLAGFIEDENLGSARVAGHSMGGKCAMQLAMDFPDKVAGLAVLDMAPRAYEPLWTPYVQAMLDMDLTQITRRDQADRMLADAVPENAFRGFLLQNLKSRGNQSYFWRSGLANILGSMKDICAPISGRPYTGPALFIRGGTSDFVSDEDWEDIQNLFPKAALKIIAKAGHLVHLEHPGLVTELLTSFFTDPSGSSQGSIQKGVRTT
ncbi:MAG: alpha/beta fold hydrolase [Desulfotignum sp.]